MKKLLVKSKGKVLVELELNPGGVICNVWDQYDSVGFSFTSDKITVIEDESLTFEVVNVPDWHDITEEEFAKLWGKVVWLWNDEEEPNRGILRGFNPKDHEGLPYTSQDELSYQHASLIKPEED